MDEVFSSTMLTGDCALLLFDQRVNYWQNISPRQTFGTAHKQLINDWIHYASDVRAKLSRRTSIKTFPLACDFFWKRNRFRIQELAPQKLTDRWTNSVSGTCRLKFALTFQIASLSRAWFLIQETGYVIGEYPIVAQHCLNIHIVVFGSVFLCKCHADKTEQKRHANCRLHFCIDLFCPRFEANRIFKIWKRKNKWLIRCSGGKESFASTNAYNWRKTRNHRVAQNPNIRYKLFPLDFLSTFRSRQLFTID